jgi:hypothetical protein
MEDNIRYGIPIEIIVIYYFYGHTTPAPSRIHPQMYDSLISFRLVYAAYGMDLV